MQSTVVVQNSTTIDQLAATVRINSKNAGPARRMVEDSATVARRGADGIAEVINATVGIDVQASDRVQMVDDLGRSARVLEAEPYRGSYAKAKACSDSGVTHPKVRVR